LQENLYTAPEFLYLQIARPKIGVPLPPSGMMKNGFSPEQAQYRTSALSIIGGGATICFRRSIHFIRCEYGPMQV
jgi:hypothetical protein